MLKLEDITKIYNPGDITELCLFDKFNLHVKKGEFVSVIGSNGSGKTSLLNIICGTVKVDSGRVILDGQDTDKIKEHKLYQKIGRVYQNPAFGSCPTLTVYENMRLAENKGKPFSLKLVGKNKIDLYRENLLSLGLGLEDKMQTKVGSLSGGQRQALALLMATMTPIDFLILDEHTAALDPRTADTVMAITDKIIKEKNLTAMMVTHNLRYATDYGNRLLMMHQGKAVIDASAEEKAKLTVPDLLETFNSISIECGN